MLEGLLYLVTSFWLGAVHAATPGHGKTIAASYIVGARGRPVDALVLGIFVTLSHTSGIILVAGLATLGSAWLIPQRVEAYLAVATGVLVIGIGAWMLWTQSSRCVGRALGHPHGGPDAPRRRPGLTRITPTRTIIRATMAPIMGTTDPQAHGAHHHRHGWGPLHTHDIDAIAADPAEARHPARARDCRWTLARPGRPRHPALGDREREAHPGALDRRSSSAWASPRSSCSSGWSPPVSDSLSSPGWSSRWINWVQIGAALFIAGVGVVLTAGALRTVASLW